MIDIIINFWIIMFALGIFIGFFTLCFGDTTWDWIKESYRERNAFGIICFSIFLIIILPVIVGTIVLQALVFAVKWIYEKGLK